MMLRVQRERMSGGFFPTAREYTVGYGPRPTAARRARRRQRRCRHLHPGPMNRGLEISADAADAAAVRWSSTRSPHGVAVRMASSTTCSPATERAETEPRRCPVSRTPPDRAGYLIRGASPGGGRRTSSSRTG